MDQSHRAAAGRPRWIWAALAAALVAAVAGWWALTGTTGHRGDDADRIADTVSRPADPVQDYVQFAAAPGAPAQPWSAEVIVEGLRSLAGALGTLGIGGPDLQVDLRVSAEHLLLNPAAPATTTGVRESLRRAAEAIDRARADGRPALAEATNAIDPARPLIEQEAMMRAFFREAGGAIERLAAGERTP